MSASRPQLTRAEIFQKFHDLYQNGLGLKQPKAFEQIEKMLIEEYGLTKEEVKKQYNITLEFDAFTRTARIIQR